MQRCHISGATFALCIKVPLCTVYIYTVYPTATSSTRPVNYCNISGNTGCQSGTHTKIWETTARRRLWPNLMFPLKNIVAPEGGCRIVKSGATITLNIQFGCQNNMKHVYIYIYIYIYSDT